MFANRIDFLQEQMRKMMFDPPDFPYKELADTLRDELSSDILLYNSSTDSIDTLHQDKDPVKVTEAIVSTIENQISVSTSTDTFFNLKNITLDYDTNKSNQELGIIQSESSSNYEPILLDDYTVNQFLLPIEVPIHNQSAVDDNGPDLLALHSCVICHEIFTTDSDLLDHTISFHASENVFEPDPNTLMPLTATEPIEDENTGSFNLECDWLVCSICERVLSTMIESEPRSTIEQVCCTDGQSSVSSRKLSTMFVCDHCSYLFASGEALDRHKLTCCMQGTENYSESSEAPLLDQNVEDFGVFFICNICGKQFLSDEDLKTHSVDCQRPATRQRRPYSTSNSNKMWNCASCNQLFTTARELYRHKRGEDRPPGEPLMAYVCEDCDKVLGSMCALHTHKKMHKVSKPGYPCRVCGRRFNQSGHLAIHMRMHTGERPYPCDLCPKAFKVKVERDDHRRTHTGERPFACAECPKTFTAAARLREHARIHTDQRPYKCDICGAAFRRPYARTVHTLIHTGEKPHECDICGTAFRRSGDMWKHKRTIHTIPGNGDAN